jgi:hypothetical protein
MSLQEQKGAFVVPLTATTATTGGAVAAAANPEGAELLVLRCILRTTAHSTGAANLDIGIAANATTTNDTLIDGIAVGSAAKIADNIKEKGTNGLERQLWGATEFLTATGSASTAGLAGNIYVEYIRA